jgi:hypothetical protein
MMILTRSIANTHRICAAVDREIDGAAEIFARAIKWDHLPRAMTFERFLQCLREGTDPFTSAVSPG